MEWLRFEIEIHDSRAVREVDAVKPEKRVEKGNGG